MSYNAISLFSGLGGDTLGLEQAGCRVVAYNELKPKFCESHEANFPDSKLIYIEDDSKDDKSKKSSKSKKIHDITKISDNHIKTNEYLKHHVSEANIDVLFAGFPCQGFSNAGKKKENDPRNTLFKEFHRIANLINPDIIIGENVKGLLSRKTHENIPYIYVIEEEFKKIGYDVIYDVFKLEEYGVPQKRERLIILGVKHDNKYGWKAQFPLPTSHKSDMNLKDIIVFNMTGAIKVPDDLFIECEIPDECILTDLDNNEDEHNEICETLDKKTNMLVKKRKITERTPHPYLISKLEADELDRTYSGITHDKLFSFGKRESPIHCEIIDIRKPSKTIICTYDHQPRLFVPLRNQNGDYLRMLLPDELKQIQGFPKDYIVKGNTKEQITQIGNAVPPPLIKAIVECVIHNTNVNTTYSLDEVKEMLNKKKKAKKHADSDNDDEDDDN